MNAHTYDTLADFQNAAQADADVLMWRHGRKGATPSTRMGGGEVRALTLHIAAEYGSACVMCGTDANVYGEGFHPMTATLAVLIPSAMLDDESGIYRYGWVPGNVALAHVGCTAARNAFALATGEPVVFGADDVRAEVPMTWPSARKARSAAQDDDASTALLAARIRAGLPF